MKVAVIVRPLLQSEAQHGAMPIVNVQPPNRVRCAGVMHDTTSVRVRCMRPMQQATPSQPCGRHPW